MNVVSKANLKEVRRGEVNFCLAQRILHGNACWFYFFSGTQTEWCEDLKPAEVKPAVCLKMQILREIWRCQICVTRSRKKGNSCPLWLGTKLWLLGRSGYFFHYSSNTSIKPLGRVRESCACNTPDKGSLFVLGAHDDRRKPNPSRKPQEPGHSMSSFFPPFFSLHFFYF